MQANIKNYNYDNNKTSKIKKRHGKILFLEGTYDVAYLDRFVTALKLQGVFSQIKGLILGWFENYEMRDKDRNRMVADMVLEVTRDYFFPILEIGELGHNVENYIFPIGCRATIDADRKYLCIDEETVSRADSHIRESVKISQ